MHYYIYILLTITQNSFSQLSHYSGRIMIEHSCNKAWTSYGLVQEQKDFIGNMPCDV